MKKLKTFLSNMKIISVEARKALLEIKNIAGDLRKSIQDAR